MNRMEYASTSKIIPVLTMSPFTGVNHAILGAAAALTHFPPIETRPVLPEYLVREFKEVIGAYPHTMAGIAPLIAETSDMLRSKLSFLDGIDPFASHIVMNPGGGARRILQSLTLKHLLPNAFLVGFNYPGWAEHLFDLTVINPSSPGARPIRRRFWKLMRFPIIYPRTNWPKRACDGVPSCEPQAGP